MKKAQLASVLGLSILAAGLSACSASFTSDSTSIKKVDEVKLADGTVVRYGYIPVAPEWKCRQLDKMHESLGVDKFKGMIKFGGEYQVQLEQAVAYANEKHLKPNYIFLYVPKQTSVNGFNLAPFSEAEATYYQCKILPPIKNSLF
jgi:hypothetical protein